MAVIGYILELKKVFFAHVKKLYLSNATILAMVWKQKVGRNSQIFCKDFGNLNLPRVIWSSKTAFSVFFFLIYQKKSEVATYLKCMLEMSEGPSGFFRVIWPSKAHVTGRYI